MYRRIRELRVSNNYSEKDIAELLSISTELYLEYESGTKSIPIQYLSILAREYNTSIDYLVEETDTIKPHKKRVGDG